MATITNNAWYLGKNSTDNEDGEWVPGVCGLCIYGQCATKVHVVDGVPVKMEGNPDAPHNLGMLCARGNSAILDLYDPYRVKVPMERINSERGLDIAPQFVEISWDEALDIVADKLREIKASTGPMIFVLTLQSGCRYGHY